VSAGFGQQALANGDQSNAGATADTSSGVAETKMGMNIRLTCADGAGANANANIEYLPSWNPRGNQALCVLKRRFPMLQGAETVRATVDASGQPVLRFTYKSETAQRFAGLALQGPDRRLAVVFNGKVLGSAVIRTTAQGGEIDVTGLGERQTQGFARRLQSYLDSNESQPHAEP
jgi:preprotein translocase subunit SecD